MYTYKAKLTKVRDGDTYEFEAQLGFGCKFDLAVRLKDHNEPEKSTPEGQASTEYVTKRLKSAEEIIIRTFPTSKFKPKDKSGKYGRWLADVFIDGFNLKDLLLDQEWNKDG